MNAEPRHRTALSAVIAGSAAAAPGAYTVRPGDTLGGIAARHGVPLAEIFRLNGLGWSSAVCPGQRIRLSDTPATGGGARLVAYLANVEQRMATSSGSAVK